MKIEELEEIKTVIYRRELGKAIAMLENYLLTNLMRHELEQLTAIKADYQLMIDYWRRGYNDPSREEVYNGLLQRMFVLTGNVAVRYGIRNTSFVTSVYSRTRASRKDWSVAALRRDMETFVSDMALTSLELEHLRAPKQAKLYEEHQRLMADLFDYIWTSRLWKDSLSEAFEEIVVSPTVDSRDQQLIVSAITLSAMNAFDFNKFRLLMSVYMKTADEHVRQRALVGWVLCLDSSAVAVYPAISEMVNEAVADGRCRQELAELQMQLIYCRNAESDNRRIQNEIMPELIKNNNIKVTRNGIEEVDDDPMEDILHPEAAEQRMERLEENIKKMMDMQKQGSDIYFSGFSQMKRFPFFDAVSNWFVPFYPQHPGISGIWAKARAKRFLQSLMANGPFCDSDKYSFVLAYEQVMNHLPANITEMLDSGEATLVGTQMAAEETAKPAFQRRLYLQNLYRFFRVYPSRSFFRNPFANDAPATDYLFFANRLFSGTPLEQHFGEITAFLMKHRMYSEVTEVVENCSEEGRAVFGGVGQDDGSTSEAAFWLTVGNILLRTHAFVCSGVTAAEAFSHALQYQPGNERALVGLARASFAESNFSGALQAYDELLEKHPEHVSYQLNKAVCLTNLARYEEALKILYKLNYNAPDDNNVNRVLAWALVGDKKFEQAERIYEQLLSVTPVSTSETATPAQAKAEGPAIDDLLNCGYCLWFKGDVVSAANMFKQYADAIGDAFDAEGEFLSERDMISRQGITDTEVRLMTDMLR